MDTILQDDFSRYGLGRIKVCRGGRSPDRERWCQVVADRGGRVEDIIAWDDDTLDMHYLLVLWRLHMITQPMYCYALDGKADFGQVVALAAGGHLRRVGRLPNRAVVTVTTAKVEIPEEVPLQTEKDGPVTMVKVVKLENGLPANMVGVYYDEEVADG